MTVDDVMRRIAERHAADAAVRQAKAALAAAQAHQRALPTITALRADLARARADERSRK